MLKRRAWRGMMGAVLAGFVLAATPAAAQDKPHWVGSWAAAQQTPEPHNALPQEMLSDATLRQIIRTSIGGKVLRVQVSNAFGTEPLTIDGAHVARSADPASARIVAGSDHALTFDGKSNVVIPAGASYWSDPVNMPVDPLSSLAVTLHLPKAPSGQTGHPGSRATSYVAAGSHLGDTNLPEAKTVDHWYQLAGLAVSASPMARAIVTLGDSITDGHGATTNGNDRWPDRLAERLQANPATRDISVLNLGIGGNRILNDGLGPNALARFDRDVLAQPGVRYLIVLEGINDLGTLTREAPVGADEHAALSDRMIGALKQIVLRARMHGVKAIGATIMPDGASGYYHPDAMNEADRRKVNAWIRKPGNFDAVIDFAKLTADPKDPTRLAPKFDSGDGLHPGPQGYRAMADSIPLELFGDAQ
ncbi:SGNH/GDSL hydrolase family protein [Stakelama pacifica]|uniref:Lysophospholipase L1-like esterase n=1 Tax=Stakelama pacifica TaxID=517720 RepID=A0A4R6FY35_9SPHN|nr:lysophospholipase L1-like esterase [Stakelama pacifica]GGO91058.1 hypothetical protein GCM10011329_04880 [Stakelama pacifica]